VKVDFSHVKTVFKRYPKLYNLLKNTALSLIFFQNARGGRNNKIKYKKSLTEKIKFRINGSNNKIDILGYSSNLTVAVTGSNNIIKIMRGCNLKNLQIIISGNYAQIVLKENVSFLSSGQILHANDNTFLEIGEETTIVDGFFAVRENNSKLTIGKDCMISSHVLFLVSDGHPFYDKTTGKRLNNAKDIIVKDHVWIGANAKILKGAIIEDGSIVGIGSIVTKGFTEQNVIIAGIPGRVTKHGIRWERE
jgi:acetyltransferase-like isoleucine patch superfamily enzyme